MRSDVVREGRDLRVLLGRSRYALLPVFLTLGVGAVALLLAGYPVGDTYAMMFTEAFGSVSRLATTFASATPLIFTGLATAIAFRAGVFNISVEGSFVLGGFAAAVVGFTFMELPGPIVVVVAAIAAAAGGALVALGPALLRARLGVDEVVTTLMINFVVLGVVGTLVATVFLAPGTANNSTPLVADQARLPRLLPPSTLHAGVLVALVLTGAAAWWLRRTVAGLELRMVGINARFAFAQGVAVPGTLVGAMLVSGAVGGLGGWSHALGAIGRYTEGFSPDYGFTGIAVALLARNNPYGVVPAAVLFGALASAGSTLQLFTDVPFDIVRVLQGVIMLLVVLDAIAAGSRRKAEDR